MPTSRLLHVKREIRVLGVSSKELDSGYVVIGVVYRGSNCLDGILKSVNNDNDLTKALVDMVTNSPHRGQIRVILSSDDHHVKKMSIDYQRLHHLISKPVISLRRGYAISIEEFSLTIGSEKLVFRPYGIGRWSAESVLKISTRSDYPEAIKVADMIASSLRVVENT